MYESPIEMIMNQMDVYTDGDLYKAIQSYGVNVNEEELIKALQYDRHQYEKGYNDGYDDGYRKAIEEFAERSKERFESLEYRAKTKRKTVPVDELDSQMNWALHDVSVQIIDGVLREMEGKNND
jgi:flagellar biosynthesis/type III secretory pathway protein FliH